MSVFSTFQNPLSSPSSLTKSRYSKCWYFTQYLMSVKSLTCLKKKCSPNNWKNNIHFGHEAIGKKLVSVELEICSCLLTGWTIEIHVCAFRVRSEGMGDALNLRAGWFADCGCANWTELKFFTHCLTGCSHTLHVNYSQIFRPLFLIWYYLIHPKGPSNFISCWSD